MGGFLVGGGGRGAWLANPYSKEKPKLSIKIFYGELCDLEENTKLLSKLFLVVRGRFVEQKGHAKLEL
jgi:hypothetical protein